MLRLFARMTVSYVMTPSNKKSLARNDGLFASFHHFSFCQRCWRASIIADNLCSNIRKGGKQKESIGRTISAMTGISAMVKIDVRYFSGLVLIVVVKSVALILVCTLSTEMLCQPEKEHVCRAAFFHLRMILCVL
jgi:hypothetical protein